MKKTLLIVVLSFFIFSCTLTPQKSKWHMRPYIMSAYCEVDIYSKNFFFNGFAMLNIGTKDFHAEIFGPLGNTLLIVKKEDGMSNIEFSDYIGEAENIDLFVPIDDLIEDLRAGISYLMEGKNLTLRKKSYEVTYYAEGEKIGICWKKDDEMMCIFFVELRHIG